jgi:ribosomal protein S18 acetylase RimI-like enzyme
MHIRPMNIDDYDKVYALWISCKNMGFNDLDDSRDGIERFLLRNPDTSFVAVENDAVIGVILGGHDGRRGYIYHTCVDEKHRKQGVASMLVDACIGSMKQNGINKTALLVFSRNDAGNKFWEKMGFYKRTDVIYRNKELQKLRRTET